MATLDPEFDRRLRALLSDAEAQGYAPQVTSGFRSPEDQKRAIDSVSRNVNGRPASVIDFARGIPGYAAPVGASMHQKGQAADLSGSGLDWVRQNAGAYGVRFPESLRGTDPNHAEVDAKFWGPVQDPRDKAATIAANGNEPPRVFEVPASKGGIGPNAPAQPPAPVSPQVASFSARQPQMQPQQEQGGGLLSGIAKFAANTLNNPLFQSGAAMINAGSRGQNIGAGLLEGGTAFATAAERQGLEAKRQREAAAEQNRALLWNDMMQNPNPDWGKDLPAGALDLARALGPEVGSKLAIDLVTKHAAGWLDRAKLDETKRKNDIDARMAEAQFAEAQNTNADRALTQDTIRRQREAEMAAQQREAEMEAEIFGRPKPPAPAAPAAPRQPVPLPPPPVRRMSDEQPQQDPMLIPTQAAAPGPVAPSAPSGPPSTIRIPRNGGEDVSPEAAREYGQKLLALPRFRAMGQDIIKQADAALENKDGIEKGTKKELETSVVGDVNHLARLNDISKSYNEKYLKLGPRLRNSAMGTAEYIGLNVSAADKQNLADFSAFRSKTIANFNLLLKEASGAAVTEQELKRMMLQEPTTESAGLFSRPDSPTEFMSKLNQSRTSLINAIARKNYMRNSMNLTDDDIAKLSKMPSMPIGLDQMRDVMGRKQAEVERKIRLENPRIKPEELPPLVRKEMRGIFGI